MQNQLRQNIVNIIKQRGISISRLEKDAGLHKNFITNFLYVKSRNPRLDSVTKIATALGISIDELIGKKDDNKNYDLAVMRMDIFLDMLNHLATALPDKKDEQLKLKKLFKMMYEIYTFSLESGSFDKKFADWFVNCQL